MLIFAIGQKGDFMTNEEFAEKSAKFAALNLLQDDYEEMKLKSFHNLFLFADDGMRLTQIRADKNKYLILIYQLIIENGVVSKWNIEIHDMCGGTSSVIKNWDYFENLPAALLT
jgi:hypothetical protein